MLLLPREVFYYYVTHERRLLSNGTFVDDQLL
jgi:hypothetical protein